MKTYKDGNEDLTKVEVMKTYKGGSDEDLTKVEVTKT